MASTLNIAALSRRTGVAPDTLRKWEQRYDVLRPARTPGGQRRYSELDVDRVEWLLARLSEGYRIGEAAALLGTAAAEPARTPADLERALLAAVAGADNAGLSRLLDQVFLLPLETAFAEVLEPLLVRVGEGWERGDLTVAQEHLTTEAVRARLGRRLADARAAVRGTAVLACAPGERHDVGLLMLGVLLRADGWDVAYLGAETPFAQAASLARALRARMVCLSVTIPETIAGLDPEVLAACPLVIGGAGAAPGVACRLGAHLPGRPLPRAVFELRRRGR